MFISSNYERRKEEYYGKIIMSINDVCKLQKLGEGS